MRDASASNSSSSVQDCAFHYLYAPEFTPNLSSAAHPRTLNPAILSKLEHGEPQWIILSLGGNEHNVLSILQLYEKYDFILGEEPDLPLTAGAEIYPEAMARETLRDWMSDALDLLLAFRRESQAPMAQVAPPPPLPKAHILAHPGDLLPDATVRTKISPDILRYKMWRLACGLYRETCQKAGIGYIRTPADMIDENGMLAEPYWGADATHANEAFGRRMIEEALQHLAGVAEGR
jgi:hypothetical protein